MKPSCYNCAYGHERYDKRGFVVGVDCARENIRYLPDMHIKLFSPCDWWSERDDRWHTSHCRWDGRT